MKLTEKIETALNETRMLILGAQALLGLQFAIVLTKTFEQLSSGLRQTHALSLGLVAVSVILLMAAAYHRIVYDGEDAPGMYTVGSVLVIAATVPLAAGIAGDIYVVITMIAGAEVGLASAAASILLFRACGTPFRSPCGFGGAVRPQDVMTRPQPNRIADCSQRL
jgi:hypothetical protein